MKSIERMHIKIRLINKSFDHSWLFVVAYLAMLALAFPRGTIATSDDFGYLDTAAKSIAHGHPETSDWLEPNSILIGILSIIAYAATKSFYLSTHGVLLFFSVVNLFIVTALFQEASGRPSRDCRMASFILLSMPIFFSKMVDFTGFSPYIFFYSLSIIFFLRRRLWAMAASVLAAFLLRESAVALLALFAFNLKDQITLKRFKHVELMPALLPAALTLAGMAIAKRLANITYAQRNVTQKLLERLDLGQSLSIFLMIGIIFMTSYVLTLLSVSNLRLKPLSFKSAIPLSGLALAWYFAFFHRYPSSILWEAPYMGEWTSWMVAIICVAGAITFGCIELPERFSDNPFLYLAACETILVAVSGRAWDYYAFGSILCGMILGIMAPPLSRSRSNPILLFLGSTALLPIFVHYSIRLGSQKEYARHAIIIYEDMHRKGYSPTGFANMPFGYAGWKLFNYYIRNEGLEFNGLAKFTCYRDSRSLAINWSPKQPSLSQGEDIKGTYRLSKWWIPWKSNIYTVVSIPETKIVPTKEYCKNYFFKSLDNASTPVFPLNDAEWSEYIDVLSRNRNRTSQKD